MSFIRIKRSKQNRNHENKEVTMKDSRSEQILSDIREFNLRVDTLVAELTNSVAETNPDLLREKRNDCK